MDIGPVIMGHPSSATPTSSLIRLVRGATLPLLTRVTTLHANGGQTFENRERKRKKPVQSSIKNIPSQRKILFYINFYDSPHKKQGKNTNNRN